MLNTTAPQTAAATPKPCASFIWTFAQAQRNGNAAHAHEHRAGWSAIVYHRAYAATMRAYGYPCTCSSCTGAQQPC